MTRSGVCAALGALVALVLGAVACTSSPTTSVVTTTLSATTSEATHGPSRSTSDVFAQIHGWIAYAGRWGKSGIWAVNPEGPGDPKDQILLSPEPGWPVAWSSDGSRLLILRPNTERPSTQAFFGTNLFLLNADGTETRLTSGEALVFGWLVLAGRI